jgi:serine/threonine-protein kinase
VADDREPREGQVLCAACHADPERIVRRLLEQAEGGDREHSPVRGYTLLRELGQGGMGAVYLARNDETGDEVALKLMLPKVAASTEARQRFLREIQLARTLRHTNIAAVYEAGDAQGGFYFTTEYCAGGSIDRLVARRGGTLPVDEAVQFTLQALEGLEHAHECGVVHRDLSPQNILLSDTSRAPVAKICDFGLAKAFDLAGLSGLTRTGTTAGKPHFMPRQQILNFKNAQPEVDTWAMAACLYWLLTGRPPRDFPADKDPWRVVLQDRAVPLRRRNPALPAALAEVIDEALRDQPAIGFRTATALRRALQRAMASID